MKLGVCYYPEHWPEHYWATDARQMRELGISVVRVGEFAWSRLEPARDDFQFEWLERALDTLHNEGLSIVLGTPTATPPKWLIDEHPSILAVDDNGNTRKFGSRRHYCFSSQVYREECRRIVSKVAEHFGQHPGLIAWQTDNEYGCHSTIASYSADAAQCFRHWCKKRYGSIEQLNIAWGNVFWSMEYRSFDEIDLPCLAVTELNPAHRLAFWRFSSDQVADFNRLQVEILRKHSPHCDLLHNYMGNFTEFDHYTTAADLDIASWDNYPLGFLDRDGANNEHKRKWYRTGHPDSSTFHHELYRAMGNGRLWVMEQQPGPVNWAPHNPAPLPGMVRLWALEAYAHGAQVMSWFRWRQLPTSQEQMHTGLLRPDNSQDTAVDEIRQLVSDLTTIETVVNNTAETKAQVAIIFDYTGDQMCRIQPQGNNFDALDWVQQVYTSMRQHGVNVDVIPATADLSAYRFIVLANSISIDQTLLQSIQSCTAQVIIGPRCGSKTAELSIPESLPPGDLQSLIPIKVIRTESLPDFALLPTNHDTLLAWRWREQIESELAPVSEFDDNWGFYYQHDRFHYLNCCLPPESLSLFMKDRLQQAGITTLPFQDGLRYSHYKSLLFAFNYGPDTVSLPHSGHYIVGSNSLSPGDVAVIHTDSHS